MSWQASAKIWHCQNAEKAVRIIRKNLVEGTPKAFSYFLKAIKYNFNCYSCSGNHKYSIGQWNPSSHRLQRRICEVLPGYDQYYLRIWVNVFLNETTHLSFITSSNSSLHYYLYGLIPEKTSNPAYLGGVRVVNMAFSFGNASDGPNVAVSEPSLPFPVNASMQFHINCKCILAVCIHLELLPSACYYLLLWRCYLAKMELDGS